MIRTIWRFFSLSAGICVFAWASANSAYPERTVHLIVGSAAGGATDALSRLIAMKLSEKWNQPVLVENRPGANGAISEELIAHAAPDGYTIGIVNDSHTILPMQTKVNYDPTGFTSIAILASPLDILVVNPTSVPVGNIKEFVAYAKARPGKLNVGSSGKGFSNWLEMQVFNQRAGIDMVNISYKNGTAAIIAALLGGEIQAMMLSPSSGGDLIRSGRIKALGVDSKVRWAEMPDLPTIAEAADLPGFDESGYQALVAPAGVPKDIVNEISAQILVALKLPDMQKNLAVRAEIPIGTTPAETESYMEREHAKWEKIFKTMNINE